MKTKSFRSMMLGLIILMFGTYVNAETAMNSDMKIYIKQSTYRMAQVGNGRAWQKMDKAGKMYYIKGIGDGMIFYAYFMNNIDNTNMSTYVTPFQIFDGWITSDIVEEVVEDIDMFYSNPSNRAIPIVNAYAYAYRRRHGAPSESLEKEILEYRRTYNVSK